MLVRGFCPELRFCDFIFKIFGQLQPEVIFQIVHYRYAQPHVSNFMQIQVVGSQFHQL
jgi:hypothetical protein